MGIQHTVQSYSFRLPQTLRGNQRQQGFLPGQRIAVDVGEPLKRRKGLFAHVVYQLTTKIELESSAAAAASNQPPSSNSNSSNLYNVHRRYSEIVKLYEKLVSEYEDRGVIVPPPPSKSSLGTVAVRMSTNVELNESIASAFIEKRTVALDRYKMLIACPHKSCVGVTGPAGARTVLIVRSKGSSAILESREFQLGGNAIQDLPRLLKDIFL